MRTAGLPMYDLPEVHAATDVWWSGLARALRREGIEDVPDSLTRGLQTEDIWRCENMLLSQTRGYNMIDGWSSRLSIFVARLRNGMAEAMCDPTLATAREDLLLCGMEILPIERYAEIGRLESEALKLGYRDFVPSDQA